MVCDECGTSLIGATVGINGCIQCPSCSKIIRIHPGETPPDLDAEKLLPNNQRYEFVRFLGEGASGLVFKALDKELRRFVAIKCPKVESKEPRTELLLREARAASNLRHPNIVTIHDVILVDSILHIVSEFIEGQSLKSWIDKKQPDIEAGCRVVIELCRAIQYAHECGVIHRDIKPANIMMDKHDSPHLLDFGLSFSRQIDDRFLKPGCPIGTPAFMAPEQVRGNLDQIDRRADIYSVGVIIYQMLTGNLPFSGASGSLFENIVNSPVRRPRDIDPKIPGSLEAICLKAMSKSADDRYQTASALADDLQIFLDGKFVSVYGKIEARNVTSFARRRWLTGVASVFATGLAGTSFWIWKKQSSDNPIVQCVFEFERGGDSAIAQRISEDDGLPDPKTQVEIFNGRSIGLSPGFYRVQLTVGDAPFFVYRTVPSDASRSIKTSSRIELLHRSWERRWSTIFLPKIQAPAALSKDSMVLQRGGKLRPEQAGSSFKGVEIEVAPFLLDATEVTKQAFLDVFPDAKLMEDDLSLQSCVHVEFEHAIAFAEQVGKQIPTAWQWLWAATNGGSTRFPWGNSVSEQDWPYESSNTELGSQTAPPVMGLYSGVLEWTDTPPPKVPEAIAKQIKQSPYATDPMQFRAIVGGPLDFAQPKLLKLSGKNNPMLFAYEQSTKFFPNVGFRCARNVNQL